MLKYIWSGGKCQRITVCVWQYGFNLRSLNLLSKLFHRGLSDSQRLNWHHSHHTEVMKEEDIMGQSWAMRILIHKSLLCRPQSNLLSSLKQARDNNKETWNHGKRYEVGYSGLRCQAKQARCAQSVRTNSMHLQCLFKFRIFKMLENTAYSHSSRDLDEKTDTTHMCHLLSSELVSLAGLSI